MSRPVWSNWAGNQRCTPASIVRDGALPERLRVVGVGGSSSGLVVTDDTLVKGRAWVGEPELDEEREEVTAPAGLTIGELGTWLAERGWSLPRAGTSAHPTLGGAIATASHGTGVGTTSLSDAASLRGMRVVRPDGVGVELAAERAEDREDLAALRVHLGAFGLVTHVRLAVSRGATIEVETVDAPLEAVLDPEVRASAPQVEAWWLPGSDRVLLTRRRPGGAPLTVRDGRPLARHRWWGEDVPLTLVTAIARVSPALAQALLGRFGRGPRQPRRQVGRWDHLAVGPRRYRAFSTEIAVPIEAAKEALAAVRGVGALHVPVNLRWCAADGGAFLSPAAGRAVFWVDVAWSPRVPGGYAVLREVERRLLALGGRPHWGKLGFANPRALFPDFDRWEAVRRRWDPDGRCVNQHLRRLLDGAALV